MLCSPMFCCVPFNQRELILMACFGLSVIFHGNKMELKVDVLFANFESKYKCKPLGFTAALIECAYLRYQEIDANFYLEGDENTWLTCSLYEQYKESSERSGLSLDKFLRVSDIRITDFFNKMNNWMEMAASTPTFQEHVNGLKNMYNCSMAIFRRYRVMFWDIFDSVERHDDLESNMTFLSLDELFYIVWLLHIQIKDQ
ncbi:retinoblastoma-like protein 2 [Convolutriloba macropyga]|uniref:retinoblastoma-like protein 2 n=1 Tax=Convolutriloba macropyga TaxID=536237 RepID=UPI003F52393F